MSIYIEGINMPKSCFDCPINYGEKRPEYGLSIYCRYSNGVVRDEKYTLGGRLETCGIIHVPPHGRLIDADIILQKATKGEEPFDWIDKKELLKLFFDASTIIPAESSKKE